MNYYIQKTGKKYRPFLEHPVGKYVLSFMWFGKNKTEFLLARNIHGWLASGFPMFGREYTDKNGLAQKSPDEFPWYFENKDEAISFLNRMGKEWKQAYSVYKVTEKGFRLVKSGQNG